MKTFPTSKPRIRTRGFALITAMIFLVLLTLVALVALRGSGLEALVSSNNAQRAEAFESSETARVAISDIIDAHVYNRGWPSTFTGCPAPSVCVVPPTDFGTIPSALTIVTKNAWYNSNDEDATTPGFKPNNLTEDATYAINVGTTAAPANIYASLAVYKLRVDLISGAGVAQTQGYDGLGRSAAGGGGNMFFYVRSSGKDLSSTFSSTGSTSTTNYDTSSDFRYVIRN